MYPPMQDMLMQLRAIRKGDVEMSEEFLTKWEKKLLEIDTCTRERLFILTVAAEKGWKVANQLAFRKKGIINLRKR